MRTVMVIASKRYKDEVKEFCQKLTDLGVVVFEPNIQSPVGENEFIQSKHLTRMVFKGLTLESFDWIRKADIVFIYNKDNYVGVSVTMEMGYAQALGKPIYALSPETGDPCRDGLIDKIAKTPEDLIKLCR